MNTRQRIRFIRDQSRALYNELRDKHSENIVGFHVDNKKIAGNYKREYGVVFHVIEKLDERELKDSQLIRSNIQLSFPDGIDRKIKTDVEEAGKFKLQSGIGGRVTSSLSSSILMVVLACMSRTMVFERFKSFQIL